MPQRPDDSFALIDHIPTPVFVLDVSEDSTPIYAYCNSSGLKLAGCELSDFVGKTTVDVFGTEFGTPAYAEQRKTILSRKSRTFGFRFSIAGEILIMRNTLVPQLDESGKVRRIIASSSDISLETPAQNTPPAPETSSSESEQFIAMAAHDLRTPMRNVAVLADMIREELEEHGNDKAELIEMLKQTSETSMKLISDILCYAQTFRGKTTPVPYRLDLLCEDIMQTIDPQKFHQLNCPEITLSGEKSITQIVLHNLIDNAFKHGKRDHMNLTCHARMTGFSRVEITLSDDGKGFTNPGTAFLDTGDFRVDSGYGLLAIRKMIRARGGDISVTNNPDTNGSSITFTLPHRKVSTTTGLLEAKTAENMPLAIGQLSRKAAGA